MLISKYLARLDKSLEKNRDSVERFCMSENLEIFVQCICGTVSLLSN